MKNRLILFLCAFFLCSAMSWGQTWNLSATMTATLDGAGVLTISTTEIAEDMPDYTSDGVTAAPWSVDRNDIFSVVIEDGVTSIGSYAFNVLPNLSSIMIPNSVTTIGEWSVANCYNLTSVMIPNSVTTIGDYAFCNSGLTSVTIPNSVTTMGIVVFQRCTNLTAVTVDGANTNYSSVDGVLYNNDQTTLIFYPPGKGATTFVIPSTVTYIGLYAISECAGLSSVTIPNSVTMIESIAFANCTDLTSITIPNSVMNIGNNAFAGCTSLQSIQVDPANLNYSSDADGVLYNKDQSTLHTYPGGKNGNFTIPNSVTRIEDCAFISCINNLTSVIIPNSVTYIGFHAFYRCIGLTSITIPNSVIYIGLYAFDSCTSLTDVTVNWTLPLTVSPDIFNNVNTSAATLHIPSGTLTDYQADPVWGTFGTIVVDATGVSLDKTTLSLTVNNTGQLTATVSPLDATNKNLSWSSNASSVATVSTTGLITAVGVGTATITVTTNDGGYTATCNVTVGPATPDIAVTGVNLNENSAILYHNETLLLTATVLPTNATNQRVVWESDNPIVATVSTVGTVTARNIGTATITVTTVDGGFTATCNITVSQTPPATIAVTGVSLDKSSVALTTDDTEQLTAIVSPNNATNKNLSWSSSDESVAAVSDDGLITAKGEGTAIITVTTEDGGFTATCYVEVNKDDVDVEDDVVVDEDGNGSFVLIFSVPTDTVFNGSFRLTFPDGIHLDLVNTYVVSGLDSFLILSIEQINENTWLFILQPVNLRSATEMAYSRIIQIGFTIDETVATGQYQALISDLLFEFENGKKITVDELPVTITVNAPTGIPGLLAESSVYLINSRLYIDSPVAETVQVYSISGVLLQSFQKPAGKASYPINQSKGTPLIVKGGSGWVKKVINN